MGQNLLALRFPSDFFVQSYGTGTCVEETVPDPDYRREKCHPKMKKKQGIRIFEELDVHSKGQEASPEACKILMKIEAKDL